MDPRVRKRRSASESRSIGDGPASGVVRSTEPTYWGFGYVGAWFSIHLSPRWGYVGSLVFGLRCAYTRPVGRGDFAPTIRNRGTTYRKTAFQMKLTIAFLTRLALLSLNTDAMFLLRKVIN